MQASILYNQLIEISKQTSHFEERRNYISLSQIIKPNDELLHEYYNGYSANDASLLKCRLGYYMEAGLMERLNKLGATAGGEIIVPGTNNLIKGHPDFTIEGLPGDCKSYPLDAYLPEPNKLSKRIYWQLNAYMLYSNTKSSIVVAESRESGQLRVFEVRINPIICNAIAEKCKLIYYALTNN